MVIRYTIQFFAGSQPRSVGQDVLSAIVVGPFHLGALQGLALIVGVAAATLVGLGLAFTPFGKKIAHSPMTWRWPRCRGSTRAG